MTRQCTCHHGGRRCEGEITERIMATGTAGCMVMCEACWTAYYGALLASTTSRFPGRVAAPPATVEELIPLAVAYHEWDMAGALGYGEDHGDDVRAHFAELPDGRVEAARFIETMRNRMEQD